MESLACDVSPSSGRSRSLTAEKLVIIAKVFPYVVSLRLHSQVPNHAHMIKSHQRR